MPRRRFSRRPRRRRVKRRRRTAVARVRRVSGFPDMMYTTLKYTTHINFSQISNTQTFRGNSLFDIDFTSIGGQPLWFDQYAAIYDRYLVFGSSLSVQVMNLSSTVTGQIAILPSVSSSPVSTNPVNLKEQNYSRYSLIQRNSGSKVTRLFNRISTKKIRGETILDDSHGALVGSNPSRVWFWHVVAACGDLGADSVSLTLVITLSLRVKFHKRIQPTQS